MKLIMSEKELNRSAVIAQCVENKCKVADAALRLGVTPRRIKQLKKAYKEKGYGACIHGNTKIVSAKKTEQSKVQHIINLRNIPALSNSNFTHFHEIITQQYGVTVSYTTVSKILKENGFTSPKKRRRKKAIHKTRERKPCFGTMLQADASPHRWFGTTEKFSLHGFIDDATGRITGLYLCKNECLLGYLEVLRQTLTTFGIPLSLYPDRYSVFFVNPKHENSLSIEEQLNGVTKKITQFGRIIDQLGIDMFPAHCAEAKGRIERLWQTLQSRLPVEFAMNNITTIDEANNFLKTYIPLFNTQFGVEPADSYSAFVPLPHTFDLDRLLCSVITRKLSSGSTISINNSLFLIEKNNFPCKTKVDVLISEKHGIRALINGEFYPIIPLDPISYSKSVVRTGDFSKVLVDLIHQHLYADAKCA